jgi:glycosyltransferase involved in cell wall biosynthesis
MNASIFISLDGMTDPLGQSQVLPYLQGLSAENKIFLVSAEKPLRYKDQKNIVEEICQKVDIEWHPIIYSRHIPLISQFYNFLKLFFKVFFLCIRHKPQMLHCRSYVPAYIGFLISRFFSVKIIFDMRGFWADERIDGSIWKKTSLKGSLLYKIFKRIEKKLIIKASAIITLTEAAKKEIESWPFYNKLTRITVIPCCVDLDHFNYKNINPSEKEAWLKSLSIHRDSKIISYLGSIGTWYMLPEMMSFFKEYLINYPSAIFLFITADSPDLILSEAHKLNIPPQNIKIIFGKRSDVPALLTLSTFSLFFIKPLYSKKGSSPTKLAELLAMGIPVIANGSVGDMDSIFRRNNCGLLIYEFNKTAYQFAVKQSSKMETLSQDSLRAICLKEFSLSLGLERYNSVYRSLTK